MDLSMDKKTMLAGGVLITLGVMTWLVSDSGSPTALIPAFLGLVLAGLGWGAMARPDLSHHFMHGAAALALVGLLGSVGSLIGRFDGFNLAVFSQLVSVVVLGAFMYFTIKSFRSARAARKAAA